MPTFPNVPPGYRQREDGRLEPHPERGDRRRRRLPAPRRRRDRHGGSRRSCARTGSSAASTASQALLGSRIVLGELRFGDLVNPNSHSAIVDATSWQKVQQHALAARATAEVGAAARPARRPPLRDVRRADGRRHDGPGTASGTTCLPLLADSATARGGSRSAPTSPSRSWSRRCASCSTGSTRQRERRRAVSRTPSASSSAARSELDAAVRAFTGLEDVDAARRRLAELRERATRPVSRVDELRAAAARRSPSARGDWDVLTLDEQRASSAPSSSGRRRSGARARPDHGRAARRVAGGRRRRGSARGFGEPTVLRDGSQRPAEGGSFRCGRPGEVASPSPCMTGLERHSRFAPTPSIGSSEFVRRLGGEGREGGVGARRGCGWSSRARYRRAVTARASGPALRTQHADDAGAHDSDLRRHASLQQTHWSPRTGGNSSSSIGQLPNSGNGAKHLSCERCRTHPVIVRRCQSVRGHLRSSLSSDLPLPSRSCRRPTGRRSGVRDVCRGLWRRSSYDLSRDDARPWLYGIAVNLLREHRRAEERRLRAYARVPVDFGAGSDEPGEHLDSDVSAALRDSVTRSET